MAETTPKVKVRSVLPAPVAPAKRFHRMMRCFDLRFFFGLLISVIGLVFMGVLWHAYQRALETRAWTEVEATVVTSRVSDKLVPPNTPPAYTWDLAYRYRFDGGEYTAGNDRRVPTSSTDRQRIERQVQDLPAGEQVTAFVNPQRPDQAVLRHETLAPLYTMWFPGLFVIGGAGMMLARIRQCCAASARRSSMDG